MKIYFFLTIAFILILTCGIGQNQSLCDLKELNSIEDISFNKLKFELQDNIIDSVKYNCIFICAINKIKIYGNLDKAGKKRGSFLIIDKNDKKFAKGKFKNNKKDGWWYYFICCKSAQYKKDKRVILHDFGGTQ